MSRNVFREYNRFTTYELQQWRDGCSLIPGQPAKYLKMLWRSPNNRIYISEEKSDYTKKKYTLGLNILSYV